MVPSTTAKGSPLWVVRVPTILPPPSSTTPMDLSYYDLHANSFVSGSGTAFAPSPSTSFQEMESGAFWLVNASHGVMDYTTLYIQSTTTTYVHCTDSIEQRCIPMHAFSELKFECRT